MTRDFVYADPLAQLGVGLQFTRELPDGWLGAYLHDERLILLREGQSQEYEEQSFWHEAGHAYYGDRISTPAIERRAWVFAAQMIVDPMKYAAAERISTSSRYIAQELGTTTRIIETYRAALVHGQLKLVA